ncbi:hypothetical protein BC941DRAFT_246756 [Chlamydoabsidia padenii]|nr:hypothetical protein BC941DRAFT_246756 [Chlamydoabsidia padenii]
MTTSNEPSDMRLASQTHMERRASLMAYVRQKTTPMSNNHAPEQKPTPIDQQHQQSKHSKELSPDTLTVSSSLARKQKHSITSTSSRRASTTQTTGLKSSNTVQNLPRQSPVPLKKKNIHHSTTASSVSSSSHTSNTTTTVRLRKKSVVGANLDSAPASVTPSLAATLARRRRSRTESLKEGVPTSPSLHSANVQRIRKKSIVSSTQESVPPSASGEQESINPAQVTATKKTTMPPNYTRKRGKTLPGNLAKPPVIQSVALPPMKMEPIQIPLPKKKYHRNGSSCSGRISNISSEHRESLNRRDSSGEETDLKKKMGKKDCHRRFSTATTPNKKKSSPTGSDNNSNLISTSRRPSMPQLSTTKPASRKLSVSVASKGGWYSYADRGAPSTVSKLTTKSNACSMPNSPGLSAAITRSRKQVPKSLSQHQTIVNSRKNSLGNSTGASAITPQHQAIVNSRKNSLGNSTGTSVIAPQHQAIVSSRKNSLGNSTGTSVITPQHQAIVSSRKNSLGNSTGASIITPQQQVDRESNSFTADKVWSTR